MDVVNQLAAGDIARLARMDAIIQEYSRAPEEPAGGRRLPRLLQLINELLHLLDEFESKGSGWWDQAFPFWEVMETEYAMGATQVSGFTPERVRTIHAALAELRARVEGALADS